MRVCNSFNPKGMLTCCKTRLVLHVAENQQGQGQGIGGRLMKFAESEAGKRGFTELHLAIHALLSENISLYRHPGWEESGKDIN